MKVGRWRMLLPVLAAALMLSSCASVRRSVLKVGVKGDVANFSLYDEESGRYSGMEIDLAQMLCEDLGYSDIRLTTVDSTTRETLLDSAQLDMVIATYSITEERKQNYDFSDAYYTDYARIMVEESSMIDELSDLRGCRVGITRSALYALPLAEYMAQQGAIPAFDEEDFSPTAFDGGVEFVQYNSYDDISQALEEGEVDAFVADGSILSGYMGDGRILLPDKFAEQQYGVCTRKGSNLSSRVAEAVRRRIEDGSIEKLRQKWEK